MKFILSLFAFIFGTGPAQKVYAGTEDFVILDVRTPQEYGESHVNESKNIDFLNSSFKNEISKLDKSKVYKVYCRSGNRSGQAVRLMKELGFQDVENLGGLAQATKRLNRSCQGKSC